LTLVQLVLLLISSVLPHGKAHQSAHPKELQDKMPNIAKQCQTNANEWKIPELEERRNKKNAKFYESRKGLLNGHVQHR
jgi:hypothetical protein